MLREPFRLSDPHLSDPDILLILDGEISRRRARKARAHLTACWVCRARMGRLERTIEDFVSLHRRTLDPEIADPAGPRALLRTRLAALAVPSSIGQRSNLLQLLLLRPPAYIFTASTFPQHNGPSRRTGSQPTRSIAASTALKTVPLKRRRPSDPDFRS
jgi:anti-sigma factor RsiW